MNDHGVRAVQVYLPTTDEVAERYTGWFVNRKRERTCGHNHVTEGAALACAEKLLRKVRKDSR